MQLKTRKTNNTIKRVGRRPKQTFLQKDIQMANKHMKRCSTLLIIRETQITTTEISPHIGQNDHHQNSYKQ